MRLSILGAGGGFPGPGGACAGYLVEVGNRRLLLDCGPGTVGRLLERCGIEDLDGVVLTHLHADHFLDLFSLAYALLAGCCTAASRWRQVPVHVPGGGRAQLAEVSRALGHPAWTFPRREGPAAYERFRAAAEPDFLFALLPCHEYAPGHDLVASGVRVRTAAVEHGLPAAAIRLESAGASLVYSGDTRPCPALAALAAGADLLLCEATVRPGEVGFHEFHMTAADAGQLARDAGVGRLVLTHLVPWADRVEVVEEAGRCFRGPIATAREGDVLTIGGDER
ncbi:MAG TPA: MBL fold metallo-hydrolase [Candidatus Binatia bacterium]|nr:MBL fold metallo-hydrolase [Candidatus Binatia bacterium]